MIKSMTGFGRAEYNDGKRIITVEIRTVNHRYSDITIKMPRRYSFAEDKIKSKVKEIVVRGKTDVSIMVENITENDLNISLNTAIAHQYYDNLKKLSDEFGLKDEITLEFLAGMPDVIKTMPDIEDEEEILKSLLVPVEEACRKLDEMRSVEGAKLAEDLIARGKLIRELTAKISERSPKVVEEYTAKLKARIAELIGDSATIPEDRILLEAAIFADKCSITEELVRLDSHTTQLANIITKSTQPDGKKLDFLVQEMNREANTIGSKANDIEITNLMLSIKAEVEKIREQVQNIQ